ncbi:hypothetical protein C8035_v009190 [Colletotrichum spinosum]|uniref:Uncharacterized protein n=1 Tax=Colletotrichum spinosum TaxID=1347390 RepID=A0A4R8QAA8_9PEZI|nr:hypothetical protein C8035_v009190 [Colletotrichum spinosum]
MDNQTAPSIMGVSPSVVKGVPVPSGWSVTLVSSLERHLSIYTARFSPLISLTTCGPSEATSDLCNQQANRWSTSKGHPPTPPKTPTTNTMKFTSIVTALALLAPGVLSAPAESEGNALVGRATCYDCSYSTFIDGRCKPACRGDQVRSGVGQGCTQCVAGCPAANDKASNSAPYPC